MGRTRFAFSLIELLVVLAVMAVLTALSAAGYSRVLEASQAVKCLGNLRGIGAAAGLYAGDYGGQLPGTQHDMNSWVATLQPYAEGKIAYRCPIDPNKKRSYSYAINDYLTPHPYGAEGLDFSRQPSIPQPSRTLFMAENTEKTLATDHFHFADPEEGGHSPADFAGQVAVNRHGNAANYLFADLHAQKLTWEEAQQKLNVPADPFVRPDGKSN
jgi:prepilin-type N-terminal cleavage/methylation domain-containing protein/prepilin-type processing-associated H-X9-DG protein